MLRLVHILHSATTRRSLNRLLSPMLHGEFVRQVEDTTGLLTDGINFLHSGTTTYRTPAKSKKFHAIAASINLLVQEGTRGTAASLHRGNDVMRRSMLCPRARGYQTPGISTSRHVPTWLAAFCTLDRPVQLARCVSPVSRRRDDEGCFTLPWSACALILWMIPGGMSPPTTRRLLCLNGGDGAFRVAVEPPTDDLERWARRP
jgi:hypothetical protein